MSRGKNCTNQDFLLWQYRAPRQCLADSLLRTFFSDLNISFNLSLHIKYMHQWSWRNVKPKSNRNISLYLSLALGKKKISEIYGIKKNHVRLNFNYCHDNSLRLQLLSSLIIVIVLFNYNFTVILILWKTLWDQAIRAPSGQAAKQIKFSEKWEQYSSSLKVHK